MMKIIIIVTASQKIIRQFSFMNFEQLFTSFENITVAVVGDVMLDTYMWGRVERISPEAPVPIIALDRTDYRIGGAGNVALNLRSMGANVHMLSVWGNDGDGKLLDKMMQEKGINTSFSLQSDLQITTNKIRIIGRNQQMMRLDRERTVDIETDLQQQFLESIHQMLNEVNPQVLIFEDYNKGVLTEEVITTIISWCKTKKIITAVDPKRKNFFAYKQVDVFKPNLKEAFEALNLIDTAVTISNLRTIHTLLQQKLQHHISCITLSEKGVFYQQENTSELLPAHIRTIADVSGAGDTVIAVAALVYAATKDARLMAEISNLAGGLVCEEVGTVAIDRQKLMEECLAQGLKIRV
jgi:D-glycero-beta-D-manno-heptose-7-phosphate kinase